MLIEFEKLPLTARLWIFQSCEILEEKIIDIQKYFELFISSWRSHQRDLYGAIKIVKKRFIIVGLDESKQVATGCSVDVFMRFVKEIQTKYEINLMDRLSLAYEQNGKVKVCKMNQIKELINEYTIIFDNTVLTKGDFENRWRVEAKNSWCKRFL